MPRFPAKLRWWLDDRFPERRQRIVAAVAAPVIGVCTLWVVVFAARAVMGPSSASAAWSPEVEAGQRVTDQLRQTAAFQGITVRPHIDFPAKLHVTGRVASAADAKALEERVRELAGERELVIEVHTGP